MASVFCDRNPCDNLKSGIIHFIDLSLATKNNKLAINVKDHIKSQDLGPDMLRPVVIKYCPFCGTRLENNLDIVGWVRDNLDRLCQTRAYQ